MIESTHIIVDAVFDTGKFMYISLSVPLSKRKQKYNGSIQENYNLTKEDFIVIETFIAVTINKYLKSKDK